MQIKRILIALDFTDSAENALRFAIRLAAVWKAELILFHGRSSAELPGEAEMKIQAMAGLVKKAGLTYEIICERGAVNRLLPRITRSEKVDLVISGTRGEQNMGKILLGSQAAKINESAACPVIIVPEGSAFLPFHKITFATAYHDSDLDTLEQLTEWLSGFQPVIHILHIEDDHVPKRLATQKHETFVSELRNRFAFARLAPVLLQGGNTEEKLKEYMDEAAPDLLVMSSHVRTLFDRVFGHSITSGLISQLTVPLLVFHHNKEAAVKVFYI